MNRARKRLPILLSAILVCHCTILAADSVSSRWSKLRRKIDYGPDGEFKGSLEDGSKLLEQVKILMKDAKEQVPAVYKQIDRECKKLTDALKRNKMMLGVEKEEQILNAKYEQALACEQKVKSIEAKAQETGRPLRPDELDAIDGQWEDCLKLVKTLKSTIIKLRQNCRRLSGDYDRKWDEFDRKVDRLRDIAEKARDELRMRRRARK